MYGVSFGIVSDHKALQKVLKSNKGNKTYSSRLTRWVDRLLPFDFVIVHTPGRTLGMADYLSRHPSEYEGAVAKAEDLFIDWFTINVSDEISPKLPQLVKSCKSIKSRESTNAKRKVTSGVLTIHETANN